MYVCFYDPKVCFYDSKGVSKKSYMSHSKKDVCVWHNLELCHESNLELDVV